jgi:hypothetical protein
MAAPVPQAPHVESFRPGYGRPSQISSSEEEKKAATAETPVAIDDEVYEASTRPRSYKLKNPILVLGFLVAFAGGIFLFWNGMEGLLKAKFHKGGEISWKMYFFYAAMVFIFIFLVGYLFDTNPLGVEEMEE